MKTGFRTRLIFILAGLVAGALLVAFVAVWIATDRQLERSIERELSVSEKVFKELLDNRSSQLRQAAKVLTDDFGFKRAVASRDRETIVSVLVNHGERINAELMVLQTPEGEEIASSHRFSELSIRPEQGGLNRQLAVVEGQLFQLVTVPVRAPTLIAWATLGFQVDTGLAQELKSLANADISLWLESSRRVIASSLTPQLTASLEATLNNEENDITHWLSEHQLVGNQVLLSEGSDTVHVELTTSLALAEAELTQLRWQISIISAAALSVAIFLATFIARGVSRPLQQLTRAAAKLKRGDYSESPLALKDDEFGALAKTFGSMRKAISEREQRISYQASHDHLTGLPNRRFFRESLQNELKARRSTGCFLLLNIHQFRVLNDSVGQEVGDDILRQLAQRLTEFGGANAFVARIGGDEFAMLYTVSEQVVGIEHQIDTLERLLEQPFKVSGSDYRLVFNLGSVTFPEQGCDVDQLIRRAQVSVREAKKQQCFYIAYEEGLDEQHMRRLKIIEELKNAIKEDELQLVLQPKLACQTGETLGAEALLRWHSKTLGFVGPDEFIPLAEQSGAITALTHWVCQRSAELLQQWQQQGRSLKLSVNLSAVDLLSDALPRLFKKLIVTCPELPSQLVLEVTESAVMQDPENAIGRLNALKQLGFSVSIDDYGTGHSSLAQLRRLPVDELKVDRAFVQNLGTDAIDQSIVRSTIQLAHELGLRVVAEGVEDESSWALLQELKCDELQGYFFSKPLAIPDFIHYLK